MDPPKQGGGDVEQSRGLSLAAALDRDAQAIPQRTQKHTEHLLAWRKHGHEQLSTYLHRVGKRSVAKQDVGRDPTMVDTLLGKIAPPLGMSAARVERTIDAAKARTTNDHYRYCYCTDLKRLGNSFHADFSTNMSLAELQESAQSKKNCLRCWLMVESIMKFADQWQNVPSSQIIVTVGPLAMHAAASMVVLTVFWVDDAAREMNWSMPKWTSLELEIYHTKGGFPLYPNIIPRKDVAVEVNPEQCAKTILTWIQDCTSHHNICNSESSQLAPPARLIDVGPKDTTDVLRLVAVKDLPDSRVPFTALTYCWGQPQDRISPVVMTTRALIEDRFKGIPYDDLSAVFQDSITMTRLLGIRYLWIDALCIMQDDTEDFAREAGKMASIYGQAYIVLGATRAPTSDAGLFQPRAKPHVVSRTDDNGQTASVLVRRPIEHNDFITNDPRNFKSTPLFARAWCFQERLLARRVVHFARDELLFECQEKLKCECNQVPTGDGLYQNFKINCSYGLLKTSVQSRYQTWYSTLRLYTARSLTFESDRLPALSGFARLLATPEMGRYFAGMWESELPSGLLWRITRALPEANGVIERPDRYRAPTWSWAGIRAVIEGHVRFYDGIETVAKVLDVDCKLASENPFGEVAAGYIVLDAPCVEIALRTGSDEDVVASERTRFVSRVGGSNDEFGFEADLVVAASTALCVAIERDVKGIRSGKWSCLVLQKDDLAGHYYRVGTVDCPSSWVSDEDRRTIRVL